MKLVRTENTFLIIRRLGLRSLPGLMNSSLLQILVYNRATLPAWESVRNEVPLSTGASQRGSRFTTSSLGKISGPTRSVRSGTRATRWRFVKDPCLSSCDIVAVMILICDYDKEVSKRKQRCKLVTIRQRKKNSFRVLLCVGFLQVFSLLW
jgi:hypothetical protein